MTTTLRRPFGDSDGTGLLPGRGRGPQPLEQVVTDPQCVRHRGESRVHRADAREEARVDDVEVVELVCAAVHVEHGRGRVVAEPRRTRLVRAARDWNGGL